MVKRLTTENPVFEAGKKNTLFFCSHREWIIEPSCIVRNSNKVRLPRNKEAGHKAGHLDPSFSEIKDVLIYNSTERNNGMFVTEV